MSTRPGIRATPDDGELVISHADYVGPWYVDEILADGSVRETGGLLRLDLALLYADIVAHARADLETRRRLGGLPPGDVVAITVADGVYVIGDLMRGEEGYYTVPESTPGPELRETVHALAVAALVP